MASKLVNDRAESARSVAAVQAHVAPAAATLAQALTPLVTAGETVPDIESFFRLLIRWMQHDATAMVDADRLHEAELRDDDGARADRDAAAGRLQARINHVRLALTDHFGEDFGGKLGVSGATPADPKALAGFGRTFIDALRATPLPAAPDSFTSFDKDKALALVEADHTRLDAALTAIAREEREGEATLGAKSAAITTHDRTFPIVASFLEVLLRAGGQDELARRVRPSGRRPGTTTESDPVVVVAPSEPAPAPTP